MKKSRLAMTGILILWVVFLCVGLPEARGQSSFPAFPGATYDERRQAFIDDQGDYWESHGWFPGAMVHALWAWLEQPAGNAGRISEEIGYLVQEADCQGWKNCWFSGDHRPPRQLRIYLQYYKEKKVISDSDAQLLKEKLSGVAFSPGTWCAVANYHFRYLVTAYLYTTLIEDIGLVEFPPPSDDQYACPQPFTYNGHSYAGGNNYPAREIYRDYLGYKIDEWLRNGTQEDFGDAYYFAQVQSMAALADFAPDPELKKKGEMFFDFLIFNWAVGFSANHPAGGHGRTYIDYESQGKSEFPWVVFFDLYGMPDIEHRYSYADAYVFKHRFPQMLTDIVETKDEGDDFYRVIRGNIPALGDPAEGSVLPMSHRYDYITKNYNLGGTNFGTGWELNIKADDVPMKLWMEWCNTPNSCQPEGPLFNLGIYGYQHRNAVFYRGGGSLQQWTGGNAWDEQSSESGWQFFRKGKVGVAAKVSSNGPGALEVATLGVDYPSYSDFKAAIKNNTSLSWNGYTTSKGVTIHEGYVDFGSDFSSLPLDRLEVWEGHVGANDETKIVDWNNNVMTIEWRSQSCVYDFYNWASSGDCDSGNTCQVSPWQDQGCGEGGCAATEMHQTRSEGCGGPTSRCVAYHPQCQQSPCDTVGNPCFLTLSGQTCPGHIDANCQCVDDLPDDQCPSIPESCPTTCIGMGGDACSDSLANATEIPACSTGYCAPNYGSKQYCVVCDDNAWLNPDTDRCEIAGDATPPSVPTGLTATAVSSTQINLAWSVSTDNVGVAGYRIYRDESQIATTANTSYQDTGRSPSTTYTYTVAAYDGAGNDSAQSGEASATTQATPDTQSPTVPTALRATVISSTQIDLSWTASTDNVGVTGYFIYRNGTKIGTAVDASYQSTGLKPSTSYSYRVAAYDGEGNRSAKSAAVTKKTQPAPSTKFSVGDRVKTIEKANVRSAASSSGTVLGTQPKGAEGTVANGSWYWNQKWWWQIDFDSGVDGWVLQGKLKKIVPFCGNGQCETGETATSCPEDCQPVPPNTAEHTYPRIAIFHWGGYPPEYYAKFDVVMTRNTSEGFAQAVRSFNPKSLQVALPNDFMSPSFSYEDPSYPEVWNIQRWDGGCVDCPDSPWADVSDYCPRASYKTYSNLTYREFIPEYMTDLVNLQVFDGMATDGFVDGIWWDYSQIDFDRNGVNDNTEHGTEWIQETWRKGGEELIKNMRAEFIDKLGPDLGNEKIFVVNSGTWENVAHLMNGMIDEYGGGWGDWYAGWWNYEKHMRIYREPQVIVINPVDFSSDDFKALRFHLATVSLGNGYLDFEDSQSFNHFYLGYYDEYDLDLGQPTSGRLSLQCEWVPDKWVDQCVFVRFFERGAVIINVKEKPVQVSDADLRSLAGYTGPYSRFVGGQDPVWNNGEDFSGPVSLSAYTPDPSRGDALILVNATHPRTVVSDIIVGESQPETSPGTAAAALEGEWTLSCDGSQAWTAGCRTYLGSYYFALLETGSGSAVFRPTIGVPGTYEVFEWHGQLNSGSLATDVPYEIEHAGGATVKTVDQNTNAGQWNSLGTYMFNAGTSGKVTLSASGADGAMMADAIKFVFRDSSQPGNPVTLTGTEE